MFALHFYDRVFGSRGEGGAVIGQKAAKPLTAVRDWVLTFVSVVLLYILTGVHSVSVF